VSLQTKELLPPLLPHPAKATASTATTKNVEVFKGVFLGCVDLRGTTPAVWSKPDGCQTMAGFSR
jgi:hypothetical protein